MSGGNPWLPLEEGEGARHAARIVDGLQLDGAVRRLPVDPWLAELPSHLLGRISPIFAPFFPVFCAFSPSRRDGSNEPQAGAQGQETAGTGTKSSELRPSFDTPDAVGRITWHMLQPTIRAADSSHGIHADKLNRINVELMSN